MDFRKCSKIVCKLKAVFRDGIMGRIAYLPLLSHCRDVNESHEMLSKPFERLIDVFSDRKGRL